MSGPPRCAWCGRADGTLEPLVLPPRAAGRRAEVLVHPEHRAALEAYGRRVARRGGVFVVLLLGVPPALGAAAVVLAAVSAVREALLAAVLLAWVGAVLVAFPFTTPQTVALLGVRRSILVARALGALLVAAAALLALL